MWTPNVRGTAEGAKAQSEHLRTAGGGIKNWQTLADVFYGLPPRNCSFAIAITITLTLRVV